MLDLLLGRDMTLVSIEVKGFLVLRVLILRVIGLGLLLPLLLLLLLFLFLTLFLIFIFLSVTIQIFQRVSETLGRTLLMILKLTNLFTPPRASDPRLHRLEMAT